MRWQRQSSQLVCSDLSCGSSSSWPPSYRLSSMDQIAEYLTPLFATMAEYQMNKRLTSATVEVGYSGAESGWRIYLHASLNGAHLVRVSSMWELQNMGLKNPLCWILDDMVGRLEREVKG